MSFIKENIFIILGVSLPLLLIGLLALFQAASKIDTAPPEHRAAYIVNNQAYGMRLVTNIDSETKHLKISATVLKNIVDSGGIRGTTLYIYKKESGLQTYILDTSNISEENKGKEVIIPLSEEIKNLKFISNTTSPDGYKFEHSVYRSSNLMTEIFGYNRHKRKDAVIKNGIKVFLPNTSRWPQTKFVGWIEK